MQLPSRDGAPVGLVFQSLAGSQTRPRESFGVSVELLDEAPDLAKEYCSAQPART